MRTEIGSPVARRKRKTKKLRSLSADEFARRLKATVSEADKRFAFLIGAGCSVSSGVPDAAALVRDHWLPRLRDFRGQQHRDLEEWAAEEIPGYDRQNPAASYGEVMEKLFLQPEERQREVEYLCDGRFPGFGYAVLARLVTLPDGCFNAVLTTNFDDLIADALYLFTEARPLVIHHESLASFIRPTRTRPLVVKLHGDHRLSPRNTAQETGTLKEEIENQVRALIQDRGLIFVGYGGNDQGIRRMIEALPAEALPLGVFWASGQEPQGILRTWLEARDAIWVEQRDFDELMLLVRNVFDLPHPDRKRLEAVFERYADTYKTVSSRVASLPDTAPDAPKLKEAVKRTDETFPDIYAVDVMANRVVKSDPERADAIYTKGVEQFPDSAILHTSHAIFLEDILKDYGRAEKSYNLAIKADREYAFALIRYAMFLQRVSENYDLAEEYFHRALAADPGSYYAPDRYASFLIMVRGDVERAKEYHERAVEAGPNDGYILGNYAMFLEDNDIDADGAENYYIRAISELPDHPYILSRYSKYLARVRKDSERAKQYERRAQEARTKRNKAD